MIKNYFILFQFLFEAIFLSLIGGLAGLFLVYLITYIPLGTLVVTLTVTEAGYLRGPDGRLSWVNHAYATAVEAESPIAAVQEQREFLGTPARESIVISQPLCSSGWPGSTCSTTSVERSGRAEASSSRR